ncbi:putative alpha/beta hydrolase family protein [Streptomyces himastatinicus ATCC 53653]|uniref:Putative alpha/beta hydrolase family protein n=1 Tax=Streptomyces himastatinicus ATCC 53653 TaxID=457427 RepID=D9WNV3_9ACTN|nr:alpha/beta hydrolase [Streptomyces himastatinicus]EFL25960.1 putative alpha/beta hydrolase family protein [Streptomyces himastatinicus ATCC 53653]
MSKIEKTVEIPHLGGSTVGYTFAGPYDPALPTLVLINSYTTSADLYRPQFADPALGSAANLLALEPYGHGRTRSTYPHFTFWDSAIANLQALEALGIREAFVLGTSQGGWVAARMALLAPDVVKGIMALGTSMDFESPRSRDLGCWDGVEFNTPLVDALADPVGEDWVVPDELVDAVLDTALGGVSDEERDFWLATYRANYSGDAGRHRLRLSTVNLRDRDGLHGRLDEIRCPVLWLHGTADQVYSVANAQEEIGMFTRSPEARLEIIEGGQHFLSASHPEEVDSAAIDFLKRWA